MLQIIHQDIRKNNKINNFHVKEIYAVMYAKYRKPMEVESFSGNLSEFNEI